MSSDDCYYISVSINYIDLSIYSPHLHGTMLLIDDDQRDVVRNRHSS